jgi:hypothetical protein
VSEILLLAVTKMLSGLCIGGVAPGGSRWVRPVKEFGSILVGDLRLPDGALMQPFDVVSLPLGKPRPQPPHVEDVLCDFVRPRPQRVRRVPVEEREAALRAALDPHPEQVWERHERSLTLFQPADLTAIFVHDDYSGKFEARLAWPGGGLERGHPVTDLRWRALGRALLPQGGERRLTWADLRAGAHTHGPGASAVYLALGLSRNYQGQFWPIVVGVHLLPDFDVTLDERHL